MYIGKVGVKMGESENQGLNNMEENQSDISLTVKEAAQHIDESPHVIRNWMKELKSHIQTTKGNNGYHYFNREAIERLLLIQKLSREQGYSLKQIEYYLATGEDPLKPEKEPEKQDKIETDLQELKDAFKKQEQFNQALLQKLEEQNQYINESIKQRDQRLLQTMTEILDRKKQIASNEEKQGENKKGFLKKLFFKK